MGRATFSAAQFLLDDLQKYSMALFVGEPSGSKGNTYGDSRQFKLPNSKITVRASVYYWQDWSPFDSRQWTAPDIAAEMTFADYRANRDPALDAVLSYVPQQPLGAQLREAMQRNDTASAQRLFQVYMADPRHAYVDGLQALDETGSYFYNRKEYSRSATLFALAESAYPDILDAHLDAATLYRQINRPDLERARLRVKTPFSAGDPFEMLHGVRHVDFLPRDSRGPKGAIEQGARRTHEGVARPVFPLSGLLADEDDSRSATPFSENRLGRVSKQRASPAGSRGFFQGGERAGFRKVRRGRLLSIGHRSASRTLRASRAAYPNVVLSKMHQPGRHRFARSRVAASSVSSFGG